MKKLKSVLAAVMAFVIVSCLAGCVSKAEKEAANADFLKWFSTVIVELGEADGEVNVELKATDYTRENASEFVTAGLFIGDTEYVYSEFAIQNRAVLDGSGEIIGDEVYFLIDFSGVAIRSLTDYDSMTLTIKDNNGAEITLTYYPNV